MVLDSSAVERLAQDDPEATAILESLPDGVTWPAIIPSVALAECLRGRPNNDVLIDRFTKTCKVVEEVTTRISRRAGELRYRTRRGSAVDAIIVALAESDGVVLTADLKDMTALAGRTRGVIVHPTLPSKRRA
ncbi:type II toxin-antitoxin system VapC family toxin [Candidatus Poriferisodalis sp.]|uniref:type II toxin-antitoxin system VapC family toxin n=1 Tax=Candidatus Poriferisodalis sp. TaxID=3101277 RepID=UPI003B02C88E